MMPKKKLLISFSGGETSAYMTWWIKNTIYDSYDSIAVVFANTGEENEETLEFVNWCDENLDFNTVWVEPVINHEKGKGTTHKVVNFNSASRNGEPFEEMIKKYGIPNQAFPHCTRELKTQPITSYVKKELGWHEYYTAIGIREDEFDRIDPKFELKKYIYPLVDMNPSDKQKVNYFWSNQDYRLKLKGYEGNCKVCWKKSLRKLMTIAKESPDRFKNFNDWEIKYQNYTPSSRSSKKTPYRFFRNNLSVSDIFKLSEKPFKYANDDTQDTRYQSSLFEYELDLSNGCEETCEPF
jgi:3'-phosphoadenosine 5'-phosphosulfate sulfotransferase (PAPS reductase)/FAD synthetase